MLVTKTDFNGNINTLEVPITQEQLDRVNNRRETKELIQDIVPDVPAPLREFLMNGTTPEEWTNMFGKIEDQIAENEIDLSNAIELVDSHHGIYIPQIFAEKWWTYLIAEKDDVKLTEILADLQNPENENYWDSWATLIDTYKLKIKDVNYYIYHDEDLWAVAIPE